MRVCYRQAALCDQRCCANECAKDQIDKLLAEMRERFPHLMRTEGEMVEIRRAYEEVLNGPR